MTFKESNFGVEQMLSTISRTISNALLQSSMLCDMSIREQGQYKYRTGPEIRGLVAGEAGSMSEVGRIPRLKRHRRQALV